MTRQPPNDLAGLISFGIREALFDARTCVPARVERWDPSDQTIDALPLIQRVREIDGERLVDEYPVVTRIPVAFLRWGGFVIRCPISAGDIVTLMVSDREIERWLASDGGATAEPRGRNTHRLNDAIAIPGISPWSNPIPGIDDGDLVIGREDGAGELRIDPDGNVTLVSMGEVRLAAGGDADQSVPRGEDLRQYLQQLAQHIDTLTLPVSTTGSATAQTGTAGPPPVPAPQPPSTMLSQKAKVR